MVKRFAFRIATGILLAAGSAMPAMTETVIIIIIV